MNEKIDYLKSNNVDVDAGIKNTMDIDTYNEILKDFFNSLGEEINKLNNFKNNNDMANYAICVHAMKSNARTLGFTALGETCYSHEMQSKANNTDYINTNFNSLVGEVQKNYNIMKTYFGG